VTNSLRCVKVFSRHAGIRIAQSGKYQPTNAGKGYSMVDRTRSGKRCRTIQYLTTREGLLRRDSYGTIQYEVENSDRRLVFVAWDNGMRVPVFAHEIDICLVKDPLAWQRKAIELSLFPDKSHRTV
jgi:hypothetical protein